MTDFIYSRLRWLLFAFYCAICYLFLTVVVHPEFHFHIQQPSFISGSFFLHPFLRHPGGISEYIAAFVLQFFSYKGIGALFIVLAGALLVIPANGIFTVFSSRWNGFGWVYIPLIAFVALFNNYFFPFAVVVKVLFAFWAVWAFLFFAKDPVKAFLAYFVLGILLYYLAGSGMFVVFSATTLILVFYRQKLKNALLFLLLDGVCAVAIPYLGYKFLFNIPAKHLYFSILPDMVKFMTYSPNFFYYIFCYSLPAIGLLLFIFSISGLKYPRQKKKDQEGKESRLSAFANTWVIAAAEMLVVLVASGLVFGATIDTHKKNIVATDYYSYIGKWDQVIAIAGSDQEYDYQINLNYNRAIDQSGKFLDLFFSYPQMGGELSIYPDYLFAGEAIFAASDFYYDLGYISEAKHWAYESLVYFPYNQRALKSLTLSHLILGEYASANRCLKLLDKGLISSDFVKKYRPMVNDTLLVATDPELSLKRKLLPPEKELSGSVALRFTDLVNANPSNKRALDHLLVDYLLNHQLGDFVSKLYEARSNYRPLPEVFRQGMLVYCFLNHSEVPRKLIPDENIDQFNAFSTILMKYNGNDAAAKKELKGKFANTYMYYIKYNSPKVTKAVLQERKENDPI
ncbi:MAG TPA: DUF6057 family protein [Prolixibacteraceae bacterium]|nr:DUF6057 family protein [Prolixibacteraceae bacterium]